LWVIYSGRKYSKFPQSILAMPHAKKENVGRYGKDY
jgi:hypothetical protein